LKGLFYPVQIYTPLNANEMTNLKRSRGSSISAALFKNLVANEDISTILWIAERGSKILIGSEMWVIVNPLNKLTVNYFNTSTKTPFYLSRASLSVHTRPPNSISSSPFKISSFWVGNGARSISSVKYFGGGHLEL
jgi:hypothetical protein